MHFVFLASFIGLCTTCKVAGVTHGATWNQLLGRRGDGSCWAQSRVGMWVQNLSRGHIVYRGAAGVYTLRTCLQNVKCFHHNMSEFKHCWLVGGVSMIPGKILAP
ncbi:unnamed protein product, partial [Ectocarpus fasciculatus]